MKNRQCSFTVQVIVCLHLLTVPMAFSQSTVNNPNTDISHAYNNTLDSLKNILHYNGKFSDAVFCVENTYLGGNLSYENYINLIDYLTNLVLQTTELQAIEKHWEQDSANYKLNLAIFRSLFDTIIVAGTKKEVALTRIIPYSYSFSDPLGKKDWSNMFVSRLLSSRKGNCHSMAYLYKIIADKLAARCWLALAPNHIYIRNYSKKYGWYNTELTSGTFPTDAWIATTGYVSTDAIRSGIYMDTLSNQQSIALCVLDLAKGYEFQTRNYYDGFILKCCDLVLQYHPVNPMALLLKAETLKKVYLKQKEGKSNDAATTYAEMEKIYITLAKLHYREMPEKMYRQWLLSVSRQKDK